LSRDIDCPLILRCVQLFGNLPRGCARPLDQVIYRAIDLTHRVERWTGGELSKCLILLAESFEEALTIGGGFHF
jgi:hypothetical protein